LTMTQLSGVSQVTFTQNGAKVKVQLAHGQLSDDGAVLYAADYSQLLLSTAPTTTTSVSTTSVSTATAPTTGPSATSAATTLTADPSISPTQTSLPRG
jgi:urease accessory protein UreE